MKKLQQQHEEERKKALAEFEAYKQRVKEREREMKDAAETKVRDMAKELDEVNSMFAMRLKEFADLSKKLEDMSKEGSAEIKEAHEKEIADLVSNGAYRQRCSEQKLQWQQKRERESVTEQKRKDRHD